jgi:3-dehydroquinate synthase
MVEPGRPNSEAPLRVEGSFGLEQPPGGWVIEVTTAGGGGYPVRVGTSILDRLPRLLEERCASHAYALIADAQVFALHGDEVTARCQSLSAPVSIHTFPHGERNKNRTEWIRLTDELLATGLGRDGCVIALGGGVAGDLAGFVAATFMRGVPVVQLPTSLVAMVDASVGGKTAVDVVQGKNLVGAFHPPRFVLADTELCRTLPRVERAQGLAEALKHGAILDAEYFAWIVEHAGRLLAGDPDLTSVLVARSVQLKARVVSEDEREGGLRQILNFGHTLGHALEGHSGFGLRHGEAISIGMVLEARIGERLGVTRPGAADRLARALTALELPTTPANDPDPEELIRLASRDKKVRSGLSRYVLLSDIGEVDSGDGWSREVEAETVRSVLSEARPDPV